MSVFKRDRDPYRTTPPVQPPAKPSSTAPQPAAEPREVGAPPPMPAAPTRSEPPSPAPPTLQRDDAAVIDHNTQLSGTLHSQGNVVIEGEFKGEMDARETVLVDKNARTEAKLCANDVIVSGSFDGEIECKHRLQITATASITGQIQTPVLVVEDGSTVNCHFVMSRAGR